DHSRPCARSGPALFYRPCFVSLRSPQYRGASVSQHASDPVPSEYDVHVAGGLEAALLPHRNGYDQPCVTLITAGARRKLGLTFYGPPRVAPAPVILRLRLRDPPLTTASLSVAGKTPRLRVSS